MNEGQPDPRFSWMDFQAITDLPAVDEAIRAMLEDATDDNATCLIRAVVEAAGEQLQRTHAAPPNDAQRRAAFEKLANDSYGFRRSRKGTYQNPAVARDWKWFNAGLDTEIGGDERRHVICVCPDCVAPCRQGPHRTDEQIVEQTERLAGLLMLDFHRRQPEEGALFRNAEDPRAKQCWLVACQIQELLTDTDPENAVAELDEEPAAQQEAPDEWSRELHTRKLLGLVEQYGDESRTAAYHGEFHCRKKPDEVMAEIKAMLAAAPANGGHP